MSYEMESGFLRDEETRALVVTSNPAESGVPEYLDLRTAERVIPSATAAGTYLLGPQDGGSVAGTTSWTTVFRLDPADFALSGRTPKLRIKARVITNAVAPAANFTVKLHPVATWGGASGANPTVASLGTGVGNAVVSAPALGGPAAEVVGDEISFPAAGWFVLAVTTSVLSATGSLEAVQGLLQLGFD